MELDNNKYNNGKIYKIYNEYGNDEDVYFGSTILTLNQRWSKHKNSYERYKIKKLQIM